MNRMYLFIVPIQEVKMQVNIDRGMHTHLIPKGLDTLLGGFFQRCGFPDGKYTVKMGAAVKGTPHIQRQGVKVVGGVENGRQVNMRVQSGSNDSARMVSFTIPADAEQHLSLDPQGICEKMRDVSEGCDSNDVALSRLDNMKEELVDVGHERREKVMELDQLRKELAKIDAYVAGLQRKEEELAEEIKNVEDGIEAEEAFKRVGDISPGARELLAEILMG